MIGEYIADDSTEYYKVVLKYKNNSTTVVEKCTMERLKLSDMRDLLAYKLNLVYDENMRVVRVYAIVETNKFDNRIALVKDKKVSKTGEDKYTYKAILSVTGSTVGSYEIDENVYSKYRVGDIITFKPDEKDDKKIVLEETFKRESIGYKRDLIVKNFDVQNTMDVGKKEEIKKGRADIRTVVFGDSVEEFGINIISVDESDPVKNIFFEITDEKLIDMTNGIIQGMSGSPIFQDDKIVGALTHVIVDNPYSGYGIFIQKMLEEGER